MALFNKEKRIKSLGFNDIWFSFVGIFFISIILFYLLNNASNETSVHIILIRWIIFLCFTILDWIIIRAILMFLRTKYYDFKNDVKRTILLFLSLITVIISVEFIGGFLLSLFFGLLGTDYNHSLDLKILITTIISTLMIMAIYDAIYYYIRLKKSIRVEEQVKQIMVQAQLDTLRNQAQPHFLFNSLNTLRDVIDQESKEYAINFVDNLSNVYRFILDSAATNTISIREELKFVRAYVYIQLERFGNNLQIKWNIPSAKESCLVVPMSLQLLIENAIKHNIISKAKPLVISINIQDDHLIVRNKIQLKSTKIPSTKIGLKNIQKRYTLISSKTPEIINEGNEFIVKLPLL